MLAAWASFYRELLERLLVGIVVRYSATGGQKMPPDSSIITSASDILLWVLFVVVVCGGAWFFARKSPKSSFLFVVGLLLFVGITLLVIRVPYVNPEFVHSTGHALIIAGILAATVDHYLKGRVLREVTSDVSKYLVGYRLPTEVQGRIGELMQIKWIRRRFQLRVIFTEIEEDHKIKLDIQISEEVQNITSETLSYQDRLQFDFHEPVRVIALECDCDDPKGSYYLGEAELGALRSERDGSIIFKGKEVRIPPIAELIGRSYRFGARYEQCHPTKFSEVVTFSIPTIGVSIEITDRPQNYRFHISPVADYVGHDKWEFKRLFLPGEHIKILWERHA